MACALQLDAVCWENMVWRKGSGEVSAIDKCVLVPQYYDNVCCPFVACLVAGGIVRRVQLQLLPGLVRDQRGGSRVQGECSFA